MTRIKVCCIESADDARRAIASGASLLGLVSAMPGGPGRIPSSRIAEIAAEIPPGVTSVLLTSETDPERIAEQQRRCGTGAIQLCDRLRPEARRALRDALPGVGLIQVVHVVGIEALDEACDAAGEADGLLLDSGRPDAEQGALGGTGRTHDWSTSRRIVERVDVPVFLAGGLSPANVAEAIRAVRPFGVDVCSGLRSEGRLDEGKLVAFVEAVRAA